MYIPPSNSNPGGISVYVNNKLDYFIRDDLSKLGDDSESVLIESKKKRKVKVYCVVVQVYVPQNSMAPQNIHRYQ